MNGLVNFLAIFQGVVAIISLTPCPYKYDADDCTASNWVVVYYVCNAIEADYECIVYYLGVDNTIRPTYIDHQLLIKSWTV